MTEFVVTSAKALSEKRKREIIAKLNADSASVTFLVDEALIGGIVISDGEKVLDASVKGRLRSAAKNAADVVSNKPLEHIFTFFVEVLIR